MPSDDEGPDFTLLEGTIAPRILQAARAASEAMRRNGIRHALIGGLAVGAYGYERRGTSTFSSVTRDSNTTEAIKRYLQERAPELLGRFEALIEQADEPE